MKQRAWVVALAIVMSSLLCEAMARGRGSAGQDEHVTTVRGRVLNAVTKEPVPRALVVLQERSIATFTDDRGRFELKIPENSGIDNGTMRMHLDAGLVEVRKPGFIHGRRMPAIRYALGSKTGGATEATIYLVPEALIVGHVEVPGSEGDVRIQCQLYRRVMSGGRESWSPDRSFTTWVDGEFRFSELEAGTYKLITLEQVDPDSTMTAGAQLYAYPPLYYLNTTDFSMASSIAVQAGETVRVNLTVARRAYYPVKIGVTNAPVGRGLSLLVYPTGHRSPGWSLGYNPGEGAIVGSLPDGNYTVEATMQGEEKMSGLLNFAVKSAPVEGPILNLVPDGTVSVRVQERFQGGLSNFGTSQTVEGDSPSGARRFANVHVSLKAIEQLSSQRMLTSQLADGSDGQELTISNVGPGRYEVEVSSGIGYAASVQSGGKDLLRQPLVVGLGGGVPPIEVVLRDNGAEVDGTLDEETAEATTGIQAGAMVFLVPTKETGGPSKSVPAWQSTFTMQQVPPGDYLVVALKEAEEGVPYGNEEAMEELLSKGGKMIHLEAGRKVNVKVKVIDRQEE